MSRWNVLEPVITRTSEDIAWAAGFIEGEGYFGRTSTEHVEVTQKDNWSLLRLQQLYGGSLGEIHKQGFNRLSTYWRWRVSGDKARVVRKELAPQLSPWRLSQIERHT